MISTSTQITFRILIIYPTNVLSCAPLDHSGWAWPLEKQCTGLHSPRNFQLGFSVCHQASPAGLSRQLPEEVTTYSTVSTCSSSDSCFFTKNHDQLQNLWVARKNWVSERKCSCSVWTYLWWVPYSLGKPRLHYQGTRTCILRSFCLLCLQVERTSSSTFSSGFWLTPGSAQGLLPGSSIGDHTWQGSGD